MDRTIWRLLVCVIITSFFSRPPADAQPPDWAANNGISAKYPDSQYVTGYGIGEAGSAADRVGLAEQNACNDLSKKFIVSMQGELFSREVESEGKYYGEFRNTITSQTQLTLIGVEIQRYDDVRRKCSFALAVMDIRSAIDNYNFRFDELQRNINALIKSAEKAEKNDNPRMALNHYYQTKQLYIELGEAGLILQILRGRELFPSGDNVGHSLLATPSEIDSRINSLLHNNIVSIRGAAVAIAEQLHRSCDEKITIAVSPLIYRDYDFTTDFSSWFLPILETELVQYYSVLSNDSSGSIRLFTHPVMTGSYWVENDTVRINVNIADSSSKLAAASVTFPVSVVEETGINLLPRNFQQAMEDSKVFLRQDIIPSTLLLEAWTSKGNQDQVFRENDETQLSVRVNKPCYLQVLYHMANGVRLVLYNNHTINECMINQKVPLPGEFIIAKPLGIERLQFFAGTYKFPELRTINATFDGVTYDKVMAEDFIEHTVAMRGMKKKEPEREMAEKILTIRTIPQ